MKRALLASIAMATALAFAAPNIASADSHTDEDSGKFAMTEKPEKHKNKGSKFFNFEGDDIDAALAQPGGVSVDVRGFATHKSLIKLRSSWHKEIIKATEDLD